MAAVWGTPDVFSYVIRVGLTQADFNLCSPPAQPYRKTVSRLSWIGRVMTPSLKSAAAVWQRLLASPTLLAVGPTFLVYTLSIVRLVFP